MTTPDPTRSKDIEVMAEALCFVGKACDRHCPDVDHRPCPDALSSWGEDAERVLAHLQAEGMAVVPRDATDQMEAAYWRAQGMDRGSCQDTWAAMLAASPYGKAVVKEKDNE